MDGARLGDTLPFLQPDRLRRLVERRQPHGIVLPSGTDERRRLRTPGRTPGEPPPLPGDPVRRKMRKVERQNALRVRLESES
jgi:hypothetical protein